ncbi:hypothetical protein [Maribellus sediminis]|uniref:hypothetical protein n=1 Tax=Maribellus sediminis TaxID=2696285 RepID=UPI001430D0E7|nr:hypothetical protein [Maribellus sediminis]
MDKTNKLTDKQGKQPIRFVILPLKPYLAKYIQIDWNRIYSLVPYREFIEWKESRLNAPKLGRNKIPRIIVQEKLREDSIVFSLCEGLAGLLNNEEPLIKSYTQLNIQWYTNRKNLPHYLNKFVSIGYSLVKITFPVRTVNRYNNKFEDSSSISHSNHLTETINWINDRLNDLFNEYIDRKCIFSKNINSAINEARMVNGLNESHIKLSTIKRNLYRYRTAQEFSPWKIIKSDQIHKRIPDHILFKIYQDHVENGISYSQLANKYNQSKSTIVRICKNPKVSKFYNDITRYHKDPFEYFLKK